MVERYSVPGLETYTGKPCVYVRWIEQEQKCYVGRTQSLYQRYGLQQLHEVIYFEEYETSDETVGREAQLIQEFLQCGLSLANGGDSGRLYTNEQIKQIVIFRYIHKQYPPNMTARMQRWYERTYFTHPSKGDRLSNQRSYQRGRGWISEYKRGSM